MAFSRADAFKVLELPVGSDPTAVRTSYKRLALKWHPDKHNSSQESLKRFKNISVAYKQLARDGYDSDDDLDLSLDDMFELFQQVFFPTKFDVPAGYSNGYESSDYDDDDDDDDDYDTGRILTAEERERNATELITEEEKEKRRAEKRRAKKKRRREKKKLEKQQADQKKDDSKKQVQTNNDTDNKKSKNKDKKKDSGSDEEAFDATSAFFTKVVKKKKKAGVLPDTQPSSKNKVKKEQNKNNNEEEPEELDEVVLRSRKLAIRGNEMANLGHYQPAIELFSEAIALDPGDFRFLGNRSYCYDRIQQYDRALRDAEKAISLAPEWPKGYFRKGRALAGLKSFSEAEHAFMQVIKLDRNCEAAMQELLHVRTHQLTEMGFSRQEAESAIRQYSSVQTALDSLLAGVVAETSINRDVYVSDDDDIHVPLMNVPQSIPQSSQHKVTDIKMNPTNPEGLTALWVGNVLPVVSEKKLVQMFSKHGAVTSVRCLRDKYCAFINYKTKESAGKAMASLQGMECAGQRLLIKFPDNPIVNGNVVIRKTAQTASNQKQVTTNQQGSFRSGQQEQASHQSGPVNGDECYFWRTTGCSFGKNCHHKHLPQHKGIDRKPWQLTK